MPVMHPLHRHPARLPQAIPVHVSRDHGRLVRARGDRARQDRASREHARPDRARRDRVTRDRVSREHARRDHVSRDRARRERASRGYVPSDLAKTLLRTPGIERFVKSPRAFIEQLILPVRYDARNTAAVLEGSGIECPPFESYVEDLVAAVKDFLRSRRERRAMRAEAEVDDPFS